MNNSDADVDVGAAAWKEKLGDRNDSDITTCSTSASRIIHDDTCVTSTRIKCIPYDSNALYNNNRMMMDGGVKSKVSFLYDTIHKMRRQKVGKIEIPTEQKHTVGNMFLAKGQGREFDREREESNKTTMST